MVTIYGMSIAMPIVACIANDTKSRMMMDAVITVKKYGVTLNNP
ncbi:MAG: hypothetical protein NWE89_03290 [Candidatus Bathyarchaeota archaeon]|nr:hypothetical protein [Candidatus Bathyarchaeota archaeon]